MVFKLIKLLLQYRIQQSKNISISLNTCKECMLVLVADITLKPATQNLNSALHEPWC